MAEVPAGPELRWHPLLEEWVTLTPARQDRTYKPPADKCPLCPGPETEIPVEDYHIAVFENRFPSYRGAEGRCEVVCYTPSHEGSLGGQPPERVRDLVDVWIDRVRQLERPPGVRYVYVFENRGEEIGVTLHHPHGQIYAYPFVPPVIARELRAFERHRRRTGGCIYCEVLAEEGAGPRVVAEGGGFIAFVPRFARWPSEVHLAPRRHLSSLADLTSEERDGFAAILKNVLNRYDTVWERPLAYVLAIHQRPARSRRDFHLHVELYPPHRSPDRLKYLAGSELGAGAFLVDVAPEQSALELRG